MSYDHISHKKSADEVRQIYNREASTYRNGAFFKKLIGEKRLRKQLTAKAIGRILDVACGTGEYFPYFAPGSDVTAVELSPAMLALAQAAASTNDLNVDLQTMDAQQLTFGDNTFDTVITALSTCTFPDPIAALKEMGRVCKPDGQILLLEHGRSRYRLLAGYQDRNAAKMYERQACRWNQDPAQLVQDAGLRLKSLKRTLAGIYYVMEAAPIK